ncbi:MAG TPA: hypothetical protein VF677_03890 [Flavobacterium sp.]|jgi:hypothetical protein
MIYKIENDTITAYDKLGLIDSAKIVCKQYPDKIEVKQTDGTTQILEFYKDGNFSEGVFVFNKIK